jgi:hypothetical protein
VSAAVAPGLATGAGESVSVGRCLFAPVAFKPKMLLAFGEAPRHCVYVCACVRVCVCVCVCFCSFTHIVCAQGQRSGEELLDQVAEAFALKRRRQTNPSGESGKLIYLVHPLSREVQLEA